MFGEHRLSGDECRVFQYACRRRRGGCAHWLFSLHALGAAPISTYLIGHESFLLFPNDSKKGAANTSTLLTTPFLAIPPFLAIQRDKRWRVKPTIPSGYQKEGHSANFSIDCPVSLFFVARVGSFKIIITIQHSAALKR